jgi:streptogramin lyase
MDRDAVPFGVEKNRAFWKDQNGRLAKVPSPRDMSQPEIKQTVGDLDGRLWMIITGYGEFTLQDGKWERVPVFEGEDRDITPDAQFTDALGHVWLVYYACNAIVMIDGAKTHILYAGPWTRSDRSPCRYSADRIGVDD